MAKDATIEAPAAAASSGPVWGHYADGTAHIVKSKKTGATKCGHKSELVDVVGTIPAGRRPPCNECAS